MNPSSRQVVAVASVLVSWTGAAAAGAPAAPGAGAPAAATAAPAVTGLAAPAAAAGAGDHQAQAETDEYTRYELLQPDSSQFHILFEVTATSPGATAYFNPIRKGSEASGEAVVDRSSGKRLAFEVVNAEQARRSGLPDADAGTSYLRIQLPRPVPAEGGVRLLIEKTYKDPKSYYRQGADRIVFARSLGIRRNAVVLPAGWELVSCNIPSQVLPEPDGRTAVSFMHAGPAAALVKIEGRKLPALAPGGVAPRLAEPGDAAPALAETGSVAGHGEVATPAPGGAPGAGSPGAAAVPAPSAPKGDRPAPSERAHQDRTIVYFLRQPESHAFDLYHDYTESRAGTDKYLNVVRKGSASSAPSARNLDTGESLRVETLRGEALRHAGLTADELREVASAGGEIAPDAEVVIARFPRPLPAGESIRLRIAETYTDPRSYRLEGDRLVFERSFGRPRNAVLLPAGWMLGASTIPATVSTSADGRIRLDFVNPRPDEIAVSISARRRPPG